jgi:hypothetical protein
MYLLKYHSTIENEQKWGDLRLEARGEDDAIRRERLLQFQIDFSFFAGIELAERFRAAGHALELSAKFEIIIETEAEKFIDPIVLGPVGTHLERLVVFEKHHRSGNGFAIAIGNDACDGASSCVEASPILGLGAGRESTGATQERYADEPFSNGFHIGALQLDLSGAALVAGGRSTLETRAA